MKILVTGGAGFIGSHFVKYWLTKHPEDEITVLDLLTYASRRDTLKEVEDNPRYRFIRGDITNKEIVCLAMEDHKVVVHFAAESHVDRAIDGPLGVLWTNVYGTVVLLEEAVRQGVERFVHFSTDEVFGALELNTTDKFAVDTPYAPRSPYSASKASADHWVRAYYHTYNLPCIIINCSNNFGPFQHPEKFIPRAITNVLWEKPIPIYGDGLYTRDWLYVLDTVQATELVLEKGRIGETYLVGGVIKNISNIEIAEKILEILEYGEIEHIRDRPGHDRRYTVDWSKINRELGWEPRYSCDMYSFEERLVVTVGWYQENEPWWAPLKEEAESFYASRQG